MNLILKWARVRYNMQFLVLAPHTTKKREILSPCALPPMLVSFELQSTDGLLLTYLFTRRFCFDSRHCWCGASGGAPATLASVLRKCPTLRTGTSKP